MAYDDDVKVRYLIRKHFDNFVSTTEIEEVTPTRIERLSDPKFVRAFYGMSVRKVELVKVTTTYEVMAETVWLNPSQSD